MKYDSTYKFRWSIIGSGHIARKVARELSDSGLHQIVAVFSRNQITGEEFCKKFNCSFYDKIEAFLNVDCDCIYIASPTDSHYEYIKKCLEHGKNVLCEKPITVNSRQFENLIYLAKERDLYLSSVLAFKYGKKYQQFKNDYNAYKYGRIEKLYMSFGLDASLLKKRTRYFDPSTASGALMEHGIYMLAFIEDILGYSTDIFIVDVHMDKGVDIEAVLTMTAGEAMCNLECSNRKVLSGDAVIYCEKGLVTLPFFNRGCSIYFDDNIDTLQKEPFSFLYQFNQVRLEIMDGKKESMFNTTEHILNTMKMLDAVKQKMGIIYPQNIENL